MLITHYSRIALVHNDHHHYEPENDENQDGKYIQAIAAVISKRTVFFILLTNSDEIQYSGNVSMFFPCVSIFFYCIHLYSTFESKKNFIFSF